MKRESEERVYSAVTHVVAPNLLIGLLVFIGDRHQPIGEQNHLKRYLELARSMQSGLTKLITIGRLIEVAERLVLGGISLNKLKWCSVEC